MEKLSYFVKKYKHLRACKKANADYFIQIITFVRPSKDKNHIYL